MEDFHDRKDIQQPIALKPSMEYILIPAAPLMNLRDGAGLVGPLTLSERADKVKRYLDKKKARRFNKVRYHCRKTLAQKRTRVQGRFVKLSEISEEVTMACMEGDEEREDIAMGADLDL